MEPSILRDRVSLGNFLKVQNFGLSCVQIKENEEHKRRAREERERYDAKIKAEMMAYNPWGRSGGGAPIKDKGGNLISKLALICAF